ncbi:glycoside hydrolase family 68 protein [Candidatus Kaiserbacteria bacterium]|nr:glycoside hydrolase family 68 protein [Candidatus Kaiserbacteria bacterium]
MEAYKNYYSPAGKILWDSWFIKQGDTYHLFHLQADLKIDPKNRDNANVSIGHATSRDLVTWKELPCALKPSNRDDWDNKDLWSGSVAEKEGKYYLYYTGKNNQPGQKNIQKICLATSPDLHHWTRYTANPILEADTRYYYMDNSLSPAGSIGAWRDPFVFRDPHSDKRFMSISAKTTFGKEVGYNACVALAESDDMINWKILPPIFAPGIYDEIEATRVVFHKGYYYLFFTTHDYDYKPEFAKKFGAHDGLHCYYSDSLYGGYKPVNGNGVVFDKGHNIYDVRVLNTQDDDFIGIGWLNLDPGGNFIGRISHPMNVRIEKDKITLINSTNQIVS